MTPEKLARLAVLQQTTLIRLLTGGESAELESLRRELAMAPEVADDPSTWLTDESRRPNLDGTDWNEHNGRMCRAEVDGFLKRLYEQFGKPLAEAALQAGIEALKR